MNAQALCLNGQAILYSPLGTGKTRESPMHAHVISYRKFPARCSWKETAMRVLNTGGLP